MILSCSPTAKAVSILKNKKPKKAASFLGHLFNVQNLYGVNTTTPEMIEGAYEYFHYANGLSENDLLAEKQTLEELRTNWEQHLLDYKAKEDQLETEFKRML